MRYRKRRVSFQGALQLNKIRMLFKIRPPKGPGDRWSLSAKSMDRDTKFTAEKASRLPHMAALWVESLGEALPVEPVKRLIKRLVMPTPRRKRKSGRKPRLVKKG